MTDRGAHLVFVGLWRARPSSPGTSSAGSGRAFGARDGGGEEPTLDGIRSSGSTSGGSEGGRDPLCPIGARVIAAQHDGNPVDQDGLTTSRTAATRRSISSSSLK